VRHIASDNIGCSKTKRGCGLQSILKIFHRKPKRLLCSVRSRCWDNHKLQQVSYEWTRIRSQKVVNIGERMPGNGRLTWFGFCPPQNRRAVLKELGAAQCNVQQDVRVEKNFHRVVSPCLAFNPSKRKSPGFDWLTANLPAHRSTNEPVFRLVGIDVERRNPSTKPDTVVCLACASFLACRDTSGSMLRVIRCFMLHTLSWSMHMRQERPMPGYTVERTVQPEPLPHPRHRATEDFYVAAHIMAAGSLRIDPQTRNQMIPWNG